MDYRHVGKSGLKVSPICLGTMNLGPRVDDATSMRILDAAFDAGIQFFDTADTYGRRSGRGTEELLGRWFSQSPGRRAQAVLATKVCGRTGTGPNDSGLSARHIREACEASLRRLNVDHIDLYQMHHVDWDTPWEETQEAMQRLARQGNIGYLGTSNFPAWMLAKACESMRARGGPGLICEQSVYNLANRTIELEVVPACRHYGLGLLAYSPVGGGLLTGILSRNVEGNARSASLHTQQALQKSRPQIAEYETLCRDLGHPPAVVALAWLLSQPSAPIPVIGPRTLEHLELFLTALELDLGPSTLAELEEIFPGPGGEAPEAYTW